MSLESLLETIRQYNPKGKLRYNYMDFMQQCMVEFAKNLEFKRAIISKPLRSYDNPSVLTIVESEMYQNGFLADRHIGKYLTLNTENISDGITFHHVNREPRQWKDAFAVETEPKTNLCANFSHSGFNISFFDYNGDEKENLKERIEKAEISGTILENISQFNKIYSDFLNFCSYLNIFVIEDHQLIQNYYAESARNFRNRVEAFETGEQLLASDIRKKPDLIVTDFLTPTTKSYDEFKTLLKEIKENYRCPVYVVSIRDPESTISQVPTDLFEGWAVKPVNMTKLILKEAKRIYDTSVDSELKDFVSIITSPTGSGKSRLSDEITLHNERTSLGQMLSTREKRKDEKGPGSIISLSKEDLDTLVQNETAIVPHLYGHDGTTRTKNENYAILNKDARNLDFDSIGIHNPELIRELSQSHSIEEVTEKGRIPVIPMSGTNHLKTTEEFDNVLIAELLYPMHERIASQINRGFTQRILTQIIDAKELGEMIDETTRVYLFNQYYQNLIKKDSLEYAASVKDIMQKLRRNFDEAASMYARLGFPKTSNEFYSKLIEYYLQQNPFYAEGSSFTVESMPMLKDYFESYAKKNKKLLFTEDQIEILDIQKISNRQHYVMVLGNTHMDIKERDKYGAFAEITAGYSAYQRKKIRLNERTRGMLNNTLLMRYDPTVWSGALSQNFFFPKVTAVNPPEAAKYDLSLILGTQLMIRENEIEDRPGLTVVFSNNHIQGSPFSFAEPEDLNYAFRNPKQNYFMGHFFRQVQTWHAEKEKKNYENLGREKYIENFIQKHQNLFHQSMQS